jgi:hypothetical protein
MRVNRLSRRVPPFTLGFISVLYRIVPDDN